MSLLPRHLLRLLRKKKRGNQRGYSLETAALELARPHEAPDRGSPVEWDVFPADPSVRQTWFSLTIREREVAALICMGYRNYEIASLLGIGYGTIKTHLQNIFYKFGLHSRKDIQAALQSWQAEDWWRAHH